MKATWAWALIWVWVHTITAFRASRHPFGFSQVCATRAEEELVAAQDDVCTLKSVNGASMLDENRGMDLSKDTAETAKAANACLLAVARWAIGCSDHSQPDDGGSSVLERPTGS